MDLFQNILSVLVPASVGSFDGCDFFHNLSSARPVSVFSPGYPENYASGTRCRWAAQAPEGSYFRLQCRLIMPQSPGCRGDKLMVSLSGDPSLSDAAMYCGNGKFEAESIQNKIVLALEVPRFFTETGNFLCKLNIVQQNLTTGECKCGWKKNTRIVGGAEAQVNEYPMMAAIIDLNKKIVHCGSTIIQNRWVLTAAHCVVDEETKNFGVLVGDHDITTGNETDAVRLYLIESFVIHERYTTRNGAIDYDIALVRTATSIGFSEKVGPACLPFRYILSDFTDETVTILGWGRLGFASQQSETLQKARVDVIPQERCESKLSGITNRQICTFAEGQDTCQADSGGPLFYETGGVTRVYVVGIVSYGVGCATNFPSVNSRVTRFLQWIIDHTDTGYCAL